MRSKCEDSLKRYTFINRKTCLFMDIESNEIDNKTWALYVRKHHFYHVLGKIKGYFPEGIFLGFKPIGFGGKRPQ